MKKIIKNFNNLIQRVIFKVENKTNNNSFISNFNKYLISFISLLFIYLFYLLIPLLYDKTWLQTKIERKLLNEFVVNISTSADISYRILPAPHFVIRDSKILVNDDQKTKSIAEIKYFKVFLDQGNFFDKEKINIKELIISDANFSLLRNDLKLLNIFKSKKLSNKKIEINNSNIFLKDNLGDIISIIKIDKSIAFFDDKKLLNFINLNGEIFNIPFNINFQYQNDHTRYSKIHLNLKPLKLNFHNESAIKNKLIFGENNIFFLNSKINTKYNVKEKLIIFKSDKSKIDNSQVSYDGELSIQPFDLDLNIVLDNQKISDLFNFNSVLIELVKSGLLFNDNISIKTLTTVDSNEKREIFQNAKINFNIINGKINLDNSTFVNNKIGLLKLSNSNLFIENNNLMLNTDIFFDIKNSNSLFSILNTNKKSRKEIKNIFVNLNYDFLKNEIKFNNIKVNNSVMSDVFLNAAKGFNDNNQNNVINTKVLINKLLGIYEG